MATKYLQQIDNNKLQQIVTEIMTINKNHDGLYEKVNEVTINPDYDCYAVNINANMILEDNEGEFTHNFIDYVELTDYNVTLYDDIDTNITVKFRKKLYDLFGQPYALDYLFNYKEV